MASPSRMIKLAVSHNDAVEMVCGGAIRSEEDSTNLYVLFDRSSERLQQELLTNQQDPAGPVTIRTSKFITNRLLNRKQFVLTVLHPTRPNLSRSELGEKLAALYKTDKARVSVFGLKTKFGGGVSQGFGLVYDDEESQRKFEPRHRLVRVS